MRYIKEVNKMKTLFGILAVIMLFLFVGTVGGISGNTIGIIEGSILCIVYLCLTTFFTYMARGFYFQKEG